MKTDTLKAPLMTVVARLLMALVLLAGMAAPAAASQEEALEFLRALEEKNKDVESLYGSFTQVRVNAMFLEEIESNGEFWYQKPNRFRCDYHEPSEARFYLLGDTGMYYTPELAQVERFQLESGDSAPINQMLVGFGLSTERILDVFKVDMPEEQPEDEGRLTIDFVSRDVERTMGYRRIRVTFDRNAMEPRVLQMEEDEDSVTVELKEVRANVDIDPEKFETDFPDDVQIIDY